MFGISFWKVVVLVAVIAVVWFGYRWLQRWQAETEARARKAASGVRGGRAIQAETMTACNACGAYVVAGARSCGKRGCPYPRQG